MPRPTFIRGDDGELIELGDHGYKHVYRASSAILHSKSIGAPTPAPVEPEPDQRSGDQSGALVPSARDRWAFAWRLARVVAGLRYQCAPWMFNLPGAAALPFYTVAERCLVVRETPTTPTTHIGEIPF